MDRIEKVLKKIDKEIEDGEVQNIRDCFNSSLGVQETMFQNDIDTAKAYFEKELNNIQSKSVDEIIESMCNYLYQIEDATSKLNYMKQIRDYIFSEAPKTSRVKGFKHGTE